MNTFFETLFSLLSSSVHAAEPIIGKVIPAITNPYGDITTDGKGLTLLISNLLRVLFVLGGMVAFINFILAGFQYMMAGGDAKSLQSAWDRIWQSLLGLVLLVGSFALASLFGYLVFGDATFILQPKIYTP